MALRVTTNEVKAIIETSLVDLDPFITSANTFINAILADEISAGNISSALLSELEKWLAAHFVAIRDPQVKSEKLGDAQATYRGKEGMGLRATTYGQQALALDSTGLLAQVGMKRAEVKTLNIVPVSSS